jgi:hypothetical protein
MTPEHIRAAINADPALLALAQAGNTQAIADALSVGRTRADTATKFTSLGISERFPTLGGLPGPLAAELLFQKLEGFATAAAASEDPATKLLGGATTRQMGHLTNNGMAIGSPAVAAMLAVIAGSGAITQAEADALVGVAAVADPVPEFDVRRAIFADDGTLLVGA